MARGWESKEVESQIESAATRPRRRNAEPEPPAKTPEQLAADREIDSLGMARLRVVRDMETASHARHKAMLEDALRTLDERIATLSKI
ncbi:MAG: hypothetical protein SGI92_33665 [Bryobacteraceae bacterium]|nr:hypothetical protein [Bryobacteraceae bacterium]